MLNLDPLSGAQRANPLATGRPLYGAGRVGAATAGQLGQPEAYDQRELEKEMRRRALQRRLGQMQTPGMMTPTAPGEM